MVYYFTVIAHFTNLAGMIKQTIKKKLLDAAVQHCEALSTVARMVIKHTSNRRLAFMHLHISQHLKHLSLHTHTHTHTPTVFCLVNCTVLYHNILIIDTHPKGTYVDSRCTSVVFLCSCCIIS